MPWTTRDLTRRARQLRQSLTRSEAALWAELRKGKLGERFRSQHVLAPFIVDFYCPSLRLVIEVDGDVHEGREDADARRDRILMERYDVTILRFKNDEVLSETGKVLERIRCAIIRIVGEADAMRCPRSD